MHPHRYIIIMHSMLCLFPIHSNNFVASFPSKNSDASFSSKNSDISYITFFELMGHAFHELFSIWLNQKKDEIPAQFWHIALLFSKHAASLIFHKVTS